MIVNYDLLHIHVAMRKPTMLTIFQKSLRYRWKYKGSHFHLV